MSGFLAALGVVVGTLAVILIVSALAALGIAAFIGHGARETARMDALAAAAAEAAEPPPDEAAAVDVEAVLADDAYVEALRDGATPNDDDDPTLTQMFAVWRDDARSGADVLTAPPAATDG